MKFDIKTLVRENILTLTPYSSARGEYTGSASVFLDANENPFGSPVNHQLNRYPDSYHTELKSKLAALKDVSADRISIGNGSDELIDQLIRIFCRPSQDAIIVCPPTFKMYEAAAAINDVDVIKVMVDREFRIDTEAILDVADEDTKILFLCSPNNPTGNSLLREDVEDLLTNFRGIVVIDEAYADFSDSPSFIDTLSEHNNLVVLQTLSKAWGLAGLRVGIAYADPEVTALLSKIKMPYNVGSLAQQLAIEALENQGQIVRWRKEILEQKKYLETELKKMRFIESIFESDANFLLVRVKDAASLYKHLAAAGIIVRNQSSQPGLNNCLRITIGRPEENDTLIRSLKTYLS